MDIQNEELPGPFAYVPSTQLIPPPVTLHPDPQRIEQAAAMLAKVERPIIIAGEGAHDARAELVALADRIGALIATTVRAKGWFDDNPYAIDIAGGFSSKVAETLFARADAVVAVGASLGDYTTAGATLFPRARVLQIDQAPFRLVDGRRLADCYVQGDARHALTALNSRLERIGHQRSGLRTAETDQLLAVDPRIAEMNEIRLNLEENCVDPRALMLELDRLLPDDCVIVIGAAHFWSFPARFLSGKRARRFFCTYDFGTIAQGVPTAVGVSIALGHRPIAVVEGDASFLMNVQDIDTAVRHRVPLLIVIMNDGALGAEYHKLNARALDVAGSVVPTPDLAEVTRAFGGGGALVTHIDELEAAARLPAPGSTPFLIDARVSRSVASRLYRRRDYRLPE